MKLTTIIATFNLILILILATRVTSYDHYVLSCGAQATVNNTQGFDGQIWHSDNNPTFSGNFSSTTTASTTTTAALETPFPTARVFSSNFTYSFPVSPGPKFIRLFFNPSSSSPYSSSSTAISLYAKDSYLTVQANSDHLLLSNFSAYLSSHASSSGQHFVQKEFYVRVTDSLLHLTFSPSRQGSRAFVNGIEVVSVPEKLYIGPPQPKNVAYEAIPFNLYDTTALENAYRVNVGGTEVNSMSDSGRMYRRWVSDDPYLIGNYQGETGLYNKQTPIYFTKEPNYSAPADVYRTFRWMGNQSDDFKKTANVTWGFEVDLGFNYLVRLHWCEVVKDINSSNYRVFSVYIDALLAEERMDIFERVGAYTAYYKDYVVNMDPRDGSTSTGSLQLAMHPYFESNPKYRDILLNGLEIFKINRPDGSLNATNPPVTTPIDQRPVPPPDSNSHSLHIIPVIFGVIAGVILLAVILFYILIFRRRRLMLKTSARESGKSGTTKASSSLPTDLCRHFSVAEIRIATSDFSDSLIVGHGGFGNVYRGTVATEAGPTAVAIKRLNPLSSQGAGEFKMEIELLSKLRHVNLVSLIGYCDDAGEMILVYEYMSHGTLRDHLYPYNTDPDAQLSWCRRLEICIGAARGLHYLHTGTDRMIIHRDVKSTNILLDERWAAKVSDFGLSKLGPTGGELSHVSTGVKGSFGYVDPEYYRRQQLTKKSDVYSFGVVLFEVLCGRAAVNPNLPKEQVNLRIWATRNQMSGTLDTIVDSTLKGQIVPECLRKFGEVAESCVRDEGVHRPSMADVIGGLELALHFQLDSSAKSTGQHNEDDEYTPDEQFQPINISSPTTDASVGLIRSPGESTWTSINNSTSRLFSSTTSEGYGQSPAVFSQIFNPEGR